MPIPQQKEPLDGMSSTLGDMVFDRLAALILDGSLAEGEQVRDKKIAEWLGVSRTPVREALSRLISVGLVESEPSRYTRVTVVTDAMIEKTFEYTGYMAGLAVRMALRNMDDTQLEHAVTLLGAMIEASDADDAPTLYATARAFNRFLALSTENPMFIEQLRQTGLSAERNLRHRRPVTGTSDARGGSYRELRDALLDRDADRAESLVRRQHGL